MIKELMHDPIFLAAKSDVATKEDLQVVQDLLDTIDETKISSSSIASQYVVLDLETNGLRTANDDLLSISLYDPSTGKIYNRLLPLELQPTVLTTYINGIDDTDVENAVPLSQKEFDDLIA